MPDVKSFQDDVKKGNLDAVRNALAADPSLLDLVNEAGQSSLLLAKYYRQTAVADYLLSLNPKLDLFNACLAGKTEAVLEEVDREPARLEAKSSDGWTPLHLAAYFGYPEMAKALINRGAIIDSRSKNAMQNTPLHAAVAAGQRELVELLLENRADPNARQMGGWTALQAAAQNDDRESAELLLLHGAHINARSDNNQSALDLALQRGKSEMAAYLESRGAQL